MILQLDFMQFIFSFFIHLAYQLYQLHKDDDARNFIQRYKHIQPTQCHEEIDEMLANGINYKPPHFDIQMNHMAFEDLMRIIESRKQALLSFIITTFINITISPNNNHPLLYVDICNWGSMTEPILTPIAENDIYIKPMSVLFHPELTLPPSVTNVDSSIYLTQTLPDVSHVVAYNHNNRISYMKVSLCSRLVIIGRDSSVCLTPLDSNIRLFNDKPNSPLISHSGRVLNADITRDSRMIVSCGTDCQIRVAHVEAFRPIAHYKMHAEPVVSVAWDKRNEFFAGASRDRTISLWSLRSPNVLRLFIGHTLPINKVIFSQDTRNIISCANDLTMRVWDIASGNQTAMFSCGRSPPIALDVSPNNNLVACGCENGNVILWSMEKGVKVWDVNEFGSPVSDLKFTNDGSVLLASSISGALCAWNVHDNNNNSECVLKTDAIASTIDSITVTNRNLVCTAGRSIRGGIII